MLSKRLRSKLLTPGIQIALSQQGRGITCKLCPSVAIGKVCRASRSSIDKVPGCWAMMVASSMDQIGYGGNLR